MSGVGGGDRDDSVQRVYEAWSTLRGPIRRLSEKFYGGTLDTALLESLELVVSKPSWRMAELADALQLDPSTVSRIVDRLVALDLATKARLAADGRGVLIRATDEGRERCAILVAERAEVMIQFLEEFTDDDAAQLAALMERLLDGVARVAGWTRSP